MYCGRRPAGIRLLVGDLNATYQTRGHSWLDSALSATGVWRGYSCPYQPGEATNVVVRRGKASSMEIDWILVSGDTPCTSADRQCLPGLSTHKALLCDLSFPRADLPNLDPAGRKFNFARAEPRQLRAAGALVNIGLWWGYRAGMPVDGLVRVAWDLMRWCIPSNTRAPIVTKHAAEEAAQSLESLGVERRAEAVEQCFCDDSHAKKRENFLA